MQKNAQNMFEEKYFALFKHELKLIAKLIEYNFGWGSSALVLSRKDQKLYKVKKFNIE